MMSWKERADQARSRVRIEDAVRALGVRLKKMGREHIGRCPFPGHNDKRPSFRVGGKKPHLCFCFGCGQGGDVVKLAELTEGMGDWKRGVEWLESYFNLSPLGSAVTKNQGSASPPESPSVPPQQMAYAQAKLAAYPDELDDEAPETAEDFARYHEMYTALLDMLTLDELSCEDLSRRGIERDEALAWGYRSLPIGRAERIDVAERLVAEFSLAGTDFLIPGMFRLPPWLTGGDATRACLGGDWCGRRRVYASKEESRGPGGGRDEGGVELSGLLIPQRDSTGRICGLKIRNEPFPDWLFPLLSTVGELAEGEFPPGLDAAQEAELRRARGLSERWPGKYQAFSSVGREMGRGARGRLHWAGPAGGGHMPGVVWATEGEIKADVIAYYLGVRVVSLPGVNVGHDHLLAALTGRTVDEVSALRDAVAAPPAENCDAPPVRLLILAFDEDGSEGVARARGSFSRRCPALGLGLALCRWDATLGKGLDDLLTVRGGWEIVPADLI